MARRDANAGYQPKWTNFHPNSTVWVKNPLPHDVIYQVADEFNNPYRYRLPAGKVSELPGGAIATLGVKLIVDELIQNNKGDRLRIWDKDIRDKYETDIVVRIKTAPLQSKQASPEGVIDMASNSHYAADPEESEEAQREEQVPFPSINKAVPIPDRGGAKKAGIASAADAALAGLPKSKEVEVD
jgi:hypothetical protein